MQTNRRRYGEVYFNFLWLLTCSLIFYDITILNTCRDLNLTGSFLWTDWDHASKNGFKDTNLYISLRKIILMLIIFRFFTFLVFFICDVDMNNQIPKMSFPSMLMTSAIKHNFDTIFYSNWYINQLVEKFSNIMLVIAGLALFFLCESLTFAFRTIAIIFIVAKFTNRLFLVAFVWKIAFWARNLLLVFYFYLWSDLFLLYIQYVWNI